MILVVSVVVHLIEWKGILRYLNPPQYLRLGAVPGCWQREGADRYREDPLYRNETPLKPFSNVALD